MRDQEGGSSMKTCQHLLQTHPHHSPGGALRQDEAYDILNLREELVTQLLTLLNHRYIRMAYQKD